MMAVTLANRIVVAVRRSKSVPLALVVIAALTVGVTIQSARLFWAMATAVGPHGDWQAPSVTMIPQSARLALFAGFDPFFRSDSVAAGATNVTSMGLMLFGIRANASSGGGSAIIAGEDGLQVSYAVGEEVAPGVVLDSVAFDHVILSRGGIKESLYIDQSVPAETVSPQGSATPAASGSIPAATTPGGAALNADSLQKAIAFAPRNEGGRVTGLVLQPRDDGAMLKLAGFQAGDIVVAVNGRPVSSAADIAAQLRPGARMSIEVERGGSKVPIALNLEQP